MAASSSMSGPFFENPGDELVVLPVAPVQMEIYGRDVSGSPDSNASLAYSLGHSDEVLDASLRCWPALADMTGTGDVWHLFQLQLSASYTLAPQFCGPDSAILSSLLTRHSNLQTEVRYVFQTLSSVEMPEPFAARLFGNGTKISLAVDVPEDLATIAMTVRKLRGDVGSVKAFLNGEELQAPAGLFDESQLFLVPSHLRGLTGVSFGIEVDGDWLVEVDDIDFLGDLGKFQNGQLAPWQITLSTNGTADAVAVIEEVRHPPSIYADWKSHMFAEVELGDPTVSGDTADFDEDGYSVIEEYAYDLDPTWPDQIDMHPELAQSGGLLGVDYFRRIDSPSVDYLLRFNPALNASDWISASSIVDEVSCIPDEGGVLERVSVRLNNANMGLIRGFFDLNISRP